MKEGVAVAAGEDEVVGGAVGVGKGEFILGAGTGGNVDVSDVTATGRDVRGKEEGGLKVVLREAVVCDDAVHVGRGC